MMEDTKIPYNIQVRGFEELRSHGKASHRWKEIGKFVVGKRREITGHMIQPRGGDIRIWCRISASIKSRNSLTIYTNEKFSINALHHKNIFQNSSLLYLRDEFYQIKNNVQSSREQSAATKAPKIIL
jgi:hypothetical protein